MKRSRTWLLIGLVTACVFLLRTIAVAPAQTGSPAGIRLPGNPNAILTVDVAKLLRSPMAQKLDWQSKLIKGQADRPLAVPATAKRVTCAAGIHPAGMRSIWQAAVIELPNPPRLEPILRAQGGYLDQIGGRNAAWTPRDVFYVELDQHSLGIVRPAQRQYVTRWVSGQNQFALSPYLARAQAASKEADAVFAIDLDDVVGLTALRYAFDLGALPSLEKLQDPGNKLMAALAGVKGMTLTMHAGDAMTGEMVVEFEQDVSKLGDQAKPFVHDVLNWADLYETMVDKWEFKAVGTRIEGNGPMAPDVIGRLMVLLSPSVDIGQPGTQQAAAPPSAEGARPAAGTLPPAPAAPTAGAKPTPATASQQYYKAVSSILDSIAMKPSPTQSATWLISKGRVIEQLPILNVDPNLVAWGNSVAESLNRAAQELALGQQKATVAAMSVETPAAYTSYADNGGGSDTSETRAAFRNAQEQRRQVSQNERGAAAQRALDVLGPMLASRSKIRAQMTEKYGVEF